MTEDIRFAIHQDDFKHRTTVDLRKSFLIDNLFHQDEIQLIYTHYDRLIVGGAAPSTKTLKLTATPQLKADFFLQRRELGVINVGNEGKVTVDGVSHHLKFKDALYVGKGAKEVIFETVGDSTPLFYFNSAPAHQIYPTKKISFEEAESVELGSTENANHRTVRKLIVNSILPTCQLQMGLTELKIGSVWNTMPPHTHDRRTEVYFYFEIPNNQMVCHFIGEPNETRHIWMKNNEAVLSPPWSIHSGAGTANYSFIWGMAGENLDYSDMDLLKISDLK